MEGDCDEEVVESGTGDAATSCSVDEVGVVPMEDLEGTAQGTSTASFTASRAAAIQKSANCERKKDS